VVVTTRLWVKWVEKMNNETNWKTRELEILQLLALGIIGGYLSRIYSESKQRPRFIIEKSI